MAPSDATNKNRPRQKTVLGRLTALAIDAAVDASSGVDERRVAPDRRSAGAGNESSALGLGTLSGGTPPLLPHSSASLASNPPSPSPLVSSPASSPPEVLRRITAKNPNLYLADTKSSLIRHVAASTSEGVAGAIVSALVLVPVRMFLDYVVSEFRIDRDFLYVLTSVFAFEITCMVLYHESAAYRERTVFCKWPCFFLVAILVILATGGKTGVASIPLTMSVYALSVSSTWFYERCKGVNSTSLWKRFLGSCAVVVITFCANALPSFAVFIPVKFLATNYPYWNVAISGFGFPAFIIALRKLTMSWLMIYLQGKVERGELSVNKVMSMYARYSKAVALCMSLSNVVVMYLSKTISSCALSAVLSIATEVGCRLDIVWVTRAIVQEQFLQKVTAELKQVVVEPGVQRGEEDEGNVNWKERAMAAEFSLLSAEERVSALTRKNNALKEILRRTNLRLLRYGEVEEQEEEEDEEQAREEKVGVEVEEVASEEKREKNWEFILTMMAARWEKEMAAEKSCILFAAFLVYLFELSDMPSQDLAIVCAIFFFSEIVTDTILVYVLDRFFFMPILQLRPVLWKEFVAEQVMFPLIASSVALILSVADGIVNKHK